MVWRKNEPLWRHTPVRIGGPAKLFAHAQDENHLLALLEEIRRHPSWAHLPLLLIGSASNTLFPDTGFPGIVIKYQSNNPKLATVKNNFVQVDASLRLPILINLLAQIGLSGLEFFTGIPGTIGGATAVNAHGVNNCHFRSLVYQVKLVFPKTGKSRWLKKSNLDRLLGPFLAQGGIITQVQLRLRQASSRQILARIAQIKVQKATQPQASLGCVFSNLTSAQCRRHRFPLASTGWLIDKKLGLRGMKHGTCQISPIHANFIVPTTPPGQPAKASDYLALMNKIKQAAWQRFRLRLKPEIVVVNITND